MNVKKVEDVVSPLLNDVVKKTKHVHIFRKEYKTCLIKGCNERATVPK